MNLFRAKFSWKSNKGIRLDGMVKHIVAGSEYRWNIYILCSDCHELVEFLLSGYILLKERNRLHVSGQLTAVF